MADRVAQKAPPLPEISTTDDSWRAVAFQVGGIPLLIKMNSVTEVSHPPPVTRLPRVKRWVRGIANVRGEILAVVDLREFFDLTGAITPAHSRVIAVEKGETRLGMVVDRIVGMRQIRSRQVGEHSSDRCPESLKTCVSGSAEMDGIRVDIFDPEKLITHKNFSQVATL